MFIVFISNHNAFIHTTGLNNGGYEGNFSNPHKNSESLLFLSLPFVFFLFLLSLPFFFFFCGTSLAHHKTLFAHFYFSSAESQNCVPFFIVLFNFSYSFHSQRWWSLLASALHRTMTYGHFYDISKVTMLTSVSSLQHIMIVCFTFNSLL